MVITVAAELKMHFLFVIGIPQKLLVVLTLIGILTMLFLLVMVTFGITGLHVFQMIYGKQPASSNRQLQVYFAGMAKVRGRILLDTKKFAFLLVQ